MSSACGIHQVESQARAYYVQIIKVHWFKLFEKPGLLCSLASDYLWITTLFRSSFRKPSSADFEFQLILYSRIETATHLVRSDFFAKIYTNFEIRRRVPRVKKKQKLTKFNKNTHTHLSLSLCLSIRRVNVYFDVPAPVSLSLSLHLQTRFGSRSDPNGIQAI